MLYCLAKAAQRQRESDTSSSSTINPNNKRSLIPTPPGQKQPSTSAASSSRPLQRDSRLGTYFEYDLSKMVNSKGGFLVNDGGNVDLDLMRKEKERETQRNIHNLDLREYHRLLSQHYSLTSSSLQPCSLTQPSIRNARNVRQWILTRVS
jgi:DNA-repair protein complementing XP-A cells